MSNIIFLKLIYFPFIYAISITKPIADFFWLKEYRNSSSVLSVPKLLFIKINKKQYIVQLVAATLISLAVLPLSFLYIENPYIDGLVYVIATAIFMLTTLICIRSILVLCLLMVTCANMGLIIVFFPLTTVTDLGTLNNLFTNLISVFNYAALATFAAGALWQYGRHKKEEEFSTISTMSYCIGYIVLNMALAFIFLFLPTINQIARLASQ